MNTQILCNMSLLMSHGASYTDALIYAINFYMDNESDQEMENVTIH